MMKCGSEENPHLVLDTTADTWVCNKCGENLGAVKPVLSEYFRKTFSFTVSKEEQSE